MNKPKPTEETKKTTLLIPRALWLRARHRALAEDTNLRAMLLEGLELRLAAKPTKGGAS